MRRWQRVLLLTIGLGSVLTFPFWWQSLLALRYESRISAPAQAPEAPVALVFGARAYESGRLSSMLRDRVETAIDLYQTGTVDLILMSGGVHGTVDEAQAMRDYAVAHGVPAAAILVDSGGNRTYDSCYRAQETFGIRRALLVTQRFHLPRALFTCEALGISASGVSADRRSYSSFALQWSENREVPASLLALVDVVRRRPPLPGGDAGT